MTGGKHWDTDVKHWHWLWTKNALAELYTLYVCNRIEQYEMDHVKQAQDKFDLRGALPKEFISALEKGLQPGERLGKVYLAPKTWKGSKRHMQEAYADAMAIMRQFGVPHLFFTWTGNPHWPEVEDILLPDQQFIHQPMGVIRIFYEKFEELMRDIVTRNCFGQVDTYCLSVEFQKRGMPHIHMVIKLKQDAPLPAGYPAFGKPAFVDDLIRATIPAEPHPGDKSEEAEQTRRLRKFVATCQLHDCNSSCLVSGRCSKRFPKKFADATSLEEDKYPTYYRPSPENGGEVIRKQLPRTRGNLWQEFANDRVVPYNEFIALKYGSHHNLEWIGGKSECLDYIYKYICKGGDRAYVRLQKKGASTGVVNYDEIDHHFSVRFLTSMEAMWRIYGYPILRHSHTVYRLWVHPEEGVRKVFREGTEDQVLEQVEKALEEGGVEAVEAIFHKETMLTAFFATCKEDREGLDDRSPSQIREGHPRARDLLYENFPIYYTYVKKSKVWKRRQEPKEAVVSRIGSVNPKNRELTSIRILLQARRGPTSFADLKTLVGENGRKRICGVSRDTGFTEAAEALGLLESNDLWVRTLREACDERHGCRRFRTFFVNTLLCGKPPNPQQLFDTFMNSLAPRRGNETAAEQTERAYRYLEHALRQENTSCREAGLLGPRTDFDERMEAWVEEDLSRETHPSNVGDDPDAPRNTISWRNYVETNRAKFNAAQTSAFAEITAAIAADPSDENAQRLFIVKGPGGAGKTFLYNTVIAHMHASERKVIVTGSTGVSAILLIGGKTTHSAFKIVPGCDVTDTPRLSSTDYVARQLIAADVVIMDEVTMINSDILHFIDATLRSLVPRQYAHRPFGGKVILMSGDWKQLLPVMPGAARADIVAATVRNSHLFPKFKQLKLTQNMRAAQATQAHRDWITRVGNGAEWADDEFRYVEVPERLLLDSVDQMIEFCFPLAALSNPLEHAERFCENAILCPKNAEVNELNARILSLLPDDERIYVGIDKALETGTLAHLATYAADQDLEVLHNRAPSNMPPHKLTLRVGAMVMCTQNISLVSHLVNGTRLQVVKLLEYSVVCRIVTGAGKNKQIIIGPTRHRHGDERNFRGAAFERLQLPLKPSFVMTTNKSQGQTLNRMSENFQHGGLYVPLSRTPDEAGMRFLPPMADPTGKRPRQYLRNIVWTEVLDEEDRPQRVPSVPHAPPHYQPIDESGDESEDSSDDDEDENDGDN